jgi:hypothetical protein
LQKIILLRYSKNGKNLLPAQLEIKKDLRHKQFGHEELATLDSNLVKKYFGIGRGTVCGFDCKK